MTPVAAVMFSFSPLLFVLHGTVAFQASVFQPSQFSSSQLSTLDYSLKKDKPPILLGNDLSKGTYSESGMTREDYKDNDQKLVTQQGDFPSDVHVDTKDVTLDKYGVSSGTSGGHKKYSPPSLSHDSDETPKRHISNEDNTKPDTLVAKSSELDDILTKEVEKLTTKNKQQKETIKDLQSKVQKLGSKEEEEEKEVKRTQAEEIQLKKEIETLNGMMKDLMTINEDLKKKLKEKEAEVTSVTEDCETKTNEMRADLDWQYDTLNEQKVIIKRCEQERDALKPKSHSGVDKTISRTSREVHEEDVKCPKDFTDDELAGVCYGFITDSSLNDHKAALKMCKEKYGGRLVVLNTKAKFQAITGTVRKENPHHTFWVGGERTHGKFKWSDGSEFESYVWGVKKPENISQKCVRLGYASRNIKPESCVTRHYAVCEVIVDRYKRSPV